jgi:hypothetical protein
MGGQLNLLILLGAVIVLVFVAPLIVGSYLRYRGTRLITCPETLTPEAVSVDAVHAALTAFHAEPELRLTTCTRWPERKDCDQRCLLQIELAPEECLVRNLLDQWYAGKNCALCGREFHHVNWFDHKPAMLDQRGELKTWGEIRPEKLPSVLKTHSPVCWDCRVMKDLLTLHPEVAVDRTRICPPIVRED